jgi:predicted nuclease of predicted toxin-antitoxin system
MTTFRFIVDQNLPPHLVYWLREKQHSATHAQFENLGQCDDQTIWKWAEANDAIVVSKDQDFANRVSRLTAPSFLWIRWGNIRKQLLIERLEKVWSEVIKEFEAGGRFVELQEKR